MKSQYLLIAETILYKNNKLTALNIYDHFVAIKLPAEFIFDLAVLCGPGWKQGNHTISISFKSDDNEVVKLGDISIEIPHENFVYNAIANNLRFSVGDDVKNLSFVVHEGEDVIIERTYPVSGLMVPADETEKDIAVS